MLIRPPVDNKGELNVLRQSLGAQQRGGKLARDLQSVNRQRRRTTSTRSEAEQAARLH
jgi:hypothetical protein